MKLADKIGYMSSGRLLIEESPATLLSATHSSSISDALLKIQKTPTLLQSLNTNINAYPSVNGTNNPQTLGDLYIPHNHQKGSHYKAVINALILKNLKQQLRNILLLLFVILMPVLQIASFLPPGNAPTQLNLGVVNLELNLSSTPLSINCEDIKHFHTNTLCDLNMLSCIFLNLLESEKISLTYYTSEDAALASVQNGHSMGYIHFSETFSPSFVDRVLSGADNLTSFLDSQIKTRLDQSDKILHVFLLKELYKTQESFLTQVGQDCLGSKESGVYPLNYSDPVYGNADDYSNFRFTAVGFLPIGLLQYSLMSSGMRYVEERNSGMIKRLLTSGVQFWEIWLAHYVSEMVLSLVQTCLAVGVLYSLVPIEQYCIASLIYVLAIAYISSWVGISMGLFIALIVQDQLQLSLLGISAILPSVLVSGLVWPVEGMVPVLQHVTNFLPCTLPMDSIRWVWNRGLQFSSASIWLSLVVLLSYLVIVNVAVFTTTKCKQLFS